jgi:hypothetical protein
MDQRVDFGFVLPREAARVLGVCESTLQRWRTQSEGPAFVRIGGRVRYSLPMLHQYVQANTCQIGQREVA